MSHDHDHLRDGNGHLDEAELRALARQLDVLGDRFASERPGLSARIAEASVEHLAAPAVAGRIGGVRIGRVRVTWGRLALAASLAMAAYLGVAMLGQTGPARVPGGIVPVASRELPSGGRSERLLVALFDPDGALIAADPAAGDAASAVAVTRGHDVDDVAVELDELLAVGGKR